MTTEMGPRDVDLGPKERFAAQFIRGWAWVVGYVSDDAVPRFNPDTATLSISGESDEQGDAFARGRTVAQLTSLNQVAMMGVIGMCGMSLIGAAVTMSAGTATLAVLLAAVAFVSYIGSIELTSKIDVLDHTTEPAPEELDELKAEFVDGEIDEQELDERAAEVWER